MENVLSEQESHDALVFLAATLVILPLAPNRELGPFGAFNPRKIWELVVMVMAVSGASYIALRILGSHAGLALAGFVGGFISASATIGSMGNRAKRNPELGSAAISGAVLATVATIIQMLLVLLVANVSTCRALASTGPPSIPATFHIHGTASFSVRCGHEIVANRRDGSCAAAFTQIIENGNGHSRQDGGCDFPRHQ